MLQQIIELIRLDAKTGEEKVFLRRVVREHITLDALKKRAIRHGLKYNISMIRVIYNGRVYRRVIFYTDGTHYLSACWHKDCTE